MSRNGFRVLDSDLHVIEPRDLYERYLDPRYKARAPRPLDARQAYVSNWIVDGYGKVGDRGYEEHPLGTGPYRFKARRAGDSVSFEARSDWKTHWRVGANWAKHGAFKEIVFRKIPEVATRVATLRTGEQDIADLTPELIREGERAE